MKDACVLCSDLRWKMLASFTTYLNFLMKNNNQNRKGRTFVYMGLKKNCILVLVLVSHINKIENQIP
jgi:hypothetical protein